MTVVDAATVTGLVVVLPGLAVAQARALRGVLIPRLPAYASSARDAGASGGLVHRGGGVGSGCARPSASSPWLPA